MASERVVAVEIVPVAAPTLVAKFGAPADAAALAGWPQVHDAERRENVFGLLISLNMLIETPGGFDYAGAEALRWMREAGFRAGRVEALPDAHAMVIATK